MNQLEYTKLVKLEIKNRETLINNGVILELIHTSTLIHDDIIDKSFFRRNLQTINNSFGDNNALLIGNIVKDFALNKSSIKTFLLFNKISLEVNYGQFLETQSRKKDYLYIYDVLNIFYFKAGVFFEKIIKIIEKENSIIISKEIIYLSSIYGIVYQIYDDMRDLFDTFNGDKDKNLDKKNNVHSFLYVLWGDDIFYSKLKIENYNNNLIDFFINFFEKSDLNILIGKRFIDFSFEKQTNIIFSLLKNIIKYLDNLKFNKNTKIVIKEYYQKIDEDLTLIKKNYNEYNTNKIM